MPTLMMVLSITPTSSARQSTARAMNLPRARGAGAACWGEISIVGDVMVVVTLSL